MKKKDSRPGWDEYFLEIAALVAQRSTCLRRKVGALVVKDRRILATGYNGTPSGIKHCSQVGCLRDKLKIPSGERHELCLPAGEEVFTDKGYVPIEHVRVGKRVLTHRGLYRRVTKVFRRPYDEMLCYIEPWNLLPVALTPEHPVLVVRPQKCEFDSRTLCKEICQSVNNAYCTKPYVYYRPVWVPAREVREKDLIALVFDNRDCAIEELDFSFVADDLPQYYKKVLQENKKGSSYLEIQDKLGIWPSTAYNWVEGGVPRNCIVAFKQILRHGSSSAKAMPRKIKLTKDILRMIGLYLAEGCSSSNQVSFSFHRKEGYLIDEIKRTMRAVFNLDCYEDRRRNSHKLIYSSVILAKAFKTLFGADAYTKNLPHMLMRLSPEKQLCLLTAYAQGDGYKIDENTTTITTASKILALQVIHIALRLGYKPMIDSARNTYRVIWKDKRKISYGYIKDNIFYTPVRKSWMKRYQGDVYNLEVEQDHTYVTKSFIVHNCRGLHAEQNVLLQASLHGVSLKDSVLYVTNQPCIICAKMIINAGIREVVMSGSYPDAMALSFLKEAKIRVSKA